MKRVVLLICSSLVLVTPTSTHAADAEWTKISSSDYIYGYTSKKFSCWSAGVGLPGAVLPRIEVLDNGAWVFAVQGEVLPKTSSLQEQCPADFPVAVGYRWAVMRPVPPASGGNRYRITYRQGFADKEEKVLTGFVPETYLEDVTEYVDVPKEKKIPYVGTTTVKGKKKSVIKYKTKIEIVKVPITTKKEKQRLVEKYENKVTPGYKTEPSEIAVYPSVGAMNEYVAEIGSSVLCSFGFKENCKK